MRQLTAPVLTCTVLLASVLAHASEPPTLQGTAYETAASRHGISPTLLYAVTLRETKRIRSASEVSPWPWAIRTPAGGEWYDSRAEAATALEAALEKWPLRRIDVGIGQINLGWHAERYDAPAELLYTQRNLEIGAAILADALSSTDDPALGVGRYHTWSDADRAREYGDSVLRITKRLQELGD